MRQEPRTSVAEMMACSLIAPINYLSQCGLGVCWKPGNFQWNLSQNPTIFMQEKELEISSAKGWLSCLDLSVLIHFVTTLKPLNVFDTYKFNGVEYSKVLLKIWALFWRSFVHQGIYRTRKINCDKHTYKSGLIPGLRPANERRRYLVTTPLIGWAQA